MPDGQDRLTPEQVAEAARRRFYDANGYTVFVPDGEGGGVNRVREALTEMQQRAYRGTAGMRYTLTIRDNQTGKKVDVDIPGEDALRANPKMIEVCVSQAIQALMREGG